MVLPRSVPDAVGLPPCSAALAGTRRLLTPTILVSAGYFFVWAGVGSNVMLELVFFVAEKRLAPDEPNRPATRSRDGRFRSLRWSCGLIHGGKSPLYRTDLDTTPLGRFAGLTLSHSAQRGGQLVYTEETMSTRHTTDNKRSSARPDYVRLVRSTDQVVSALGMR